MVQGIGRDGEVGRGEACQARNGLGLRFKEFANIAKVNSLGYHCCNRLDISYIRFIVQSLLYPIRTGPHISDGLKVGFLT